MDKIISAVTRGIAGSRKNPLEDNEKSYIVRRLKQVDFKQFKEQTPTKIIMVLVDMLNAELLKIPKKQTEETIDMHNLMAQELGQEAETYSIHKKLNKNSTVDSLLHYPATLQRIFNPHALHHKAYLFLDRRYQLDEANNVNEFKWQVSDTTRSYNALTTVVSCIPVKDIVKIKMFPFRFPNSDRAVMDFYNLSVEIKELSTQACIVSHNNKRYHFMFDVEKTGTNPYDPYKAMDPGNSAVEFEFLDPVIELSEITIVFGNPESTISLDPDILYGTFASVGAQTVITFGKDHKCEVGCTINVVGFNTGTPLVDKAIIDEINHVRGNVVTAITSNTMTIDINSSTIGAIVGNPFYVYLNAKRFGLRLELTYLADG